MYAVRLNIKLEDTKERTVNAVKYVNHCFKIWMNSRYPLHIYKECTNMYVHCMYLDLTLSVITYNLMLHVLSIL